MSLRFKPRLRHIVTLSSCHLVIVASCHLAIAAQPQDFLRSYCISCHGPEKQKGDRRFDHLVIPAKTTEHVIDLQDIVDQLNLGDMPPKQSKQPSEAERSAIVTSLTKAVAEARATLRSTGGQTVLRRLNKREYINTVGDLFALDMRLFDPTTKFPRDQMAEHMDNLGDVLQTSGYLLAQYLDAADQVVEKAFSVAERPQKKTWRFDGNFRPQQEHTYPHGRVYNNRYLCVYEVPDTENHEGGYGYIHEFKQGVPVDGVYEIRVKAQAINRVHPYEQQIFKRDTEQPFRLGIVPGDVNAGPLHHPQPIEPELAEVTLKDGEPEWHTMTLPLSAGQTPRFIFPNGMANSRRAFGTIARQYRDQWPPEERKDLGIFEARRVVLKYGFMPHIRIHEIEIRGPIVQNWPPASQLAVLGEKPFAPERTREILKRFADRAYRRPATEDEVNRLMRVVDARVKAGHTPFDAMKDGLKAALCSPAFLYVAKAEAKNEKLGAHAFASRLSYFLWSTMPDDELRKLADSGELLKHDVKLAQTRRLLASPRSDAFIEGFLDSWLNLRSLGDMPPDRDAFARFYADGLKPAMKRETQLFMRHLITENESLTRFLDADYTFVNQALADLYKLGRISAPESAHEFRKVSLTDSHRGGLLGQGSVLTVSANGIETSPVVRGIWLLENILGTPPPPPPDNVPPIDPDVRGAKSIRDILTKHRENAGCLECHQKIDPLGFALENFDPIGQWRTNYIQGKKLGPKIDAAGELPDGKSFQDVTGLKKILLARQDQFAKMLTEKLLSYACGRRIEGGDRPQVDAILAAVAKDKQGLRTLVEQVVLSETFGGK
ncbi:DUF1592 domain-containing protein [Prosthecobacter sp.]|uniref:DUF1592 domain-containing protein n=1 Tax=Prosthecobacter sp. TaxID=1965333 RepID=UPI001D48F18F|nr:DUF1592 domain-containing protein [Prosthecobacter sp.]MCB1279840.1 DUF1592 domain-containing protein [Prosthecobacter sp.]